MTEISKWIAVTGFVLMSCILQGNTDAQDFRVESQVFVGGANTPASENLTLYQSGMAYDFQMDIDAPGSPLEIVIYDSREKQLILLDLQRKLRTDIPDFELLKMLESLRASGETNEDANFLLNPELESGFDVKTDTITVSNDDLTYRARGKAPENLIAMPFFYEAMTQFTRLSASDPKRLPPFARLALNREIQKLGLFPVNIEMSMRAGAISREEFNARSTHTVMWELSKQDLMRIEEAKRNWIGFEKVSIGVYRGIAEPQVSLSK